MFSEGTLSIPGASLLPGSDQIVFDSNTKTYVPTFGAVPSLNERFDPLRADDEDNERIP